MTTMEVRNIEISTIARTDRNPRRIVKRDIKSSELYRSIKRNGVQHPIEVRRIDEEGPERFELISGDRRLTIAEDLKLQTVPAIVYAGMEKGEAYRKTHFENAGREDLTPLERAVDARNLMLTHGNDETAVASVLGIGEVALKRRLRLGSLSPAWVKALRSPRGEKKEGLVTVHDLTLAHLELIARLDEGSQDSLLGDEAEPIPRLGGCRGRISVESLKRLIDNEYTRALSGAPWEASDATLSPEEGSCQDCQKRSDSQSQRELWDPPEDERRGRTGSRCLDERCYRVKLAAWQKRRIEEARKTHKGLRVIGSEQDRKEYGDILIARHEVLEAKKGEKDSFPVILLGEVGKAIRYAKRVADGEKETQGKRGVKPRALSQKREQLRGLRVGIVLAKLREFLAGGALPREELFTINRMAALVAMYGGTGPGGAMERNPAATQVLEAGGKVMSRKDWVTKEVAADCRTILWWKLERDLFCAIKPRNADAALDCEGMGKWLAELVQFDWDAAFAAACEERKEPKAWATVKEEEGKGNDSAAA